MPRNWSGFSIASVADRNVSRKRSSRSTASCCCSSSVFISRSVSGVLDLAISALLPLHELGPQRQLGRRERQRRLGEVLLDPFHLEHHAARLHHRHPSLGI